MSNQKLTRKGARNLTVALDRIATVIQSNSELLGLDPKVAMDFAKRADMVSDAIETTATVNFPKAAAASNGGWDPEQIGEKVAGPLERLDSDEPWMAGEFTQQEFSELAKKQEAGLLPTKGDTKVASAAELQARIARLERVLVRLAAEEKEEEVEVKEEAKKAGEEKEEVEVKEEAKKASGKFAGFNLFE